jgi:integrase
VSCPNRTSTYYTNYVEAEGLKSAKTVYGHLKALKASLGELSVIALEKPGEIIRFKATYRHGHEVATVNRALGVLRAAINWGRFQDPPLLSTTPFHRFGVSIKAREETKRDRRIHRAEDRALLAACLTMYAAEHKRVGPAMHDRIIGALETCCRQGEMLRIQNRHVDWEQHQLVIPGANAKDAENRRVPFDPQGRLAPILKRRAALGPYRSCSAHRMESSRTASRPPGSPSCWSPTGTTRSARNPVFGSTGPSCSRSTFTGTICVTKAPAASWRTASISAPSN